MLKVNFDVTSLVRENLTGIGVYTKNLISAVSKFPDINCSGSYRVSRYKKKHLINQHIQIPLQLYMPLISGLLPKEYQIFHGPDFRIPSGRAFRKVVTIHDMVVFQYDLVDKKFADMGIAKFKRTLFRGRPDHIIVDSAFTRQAFLEYFPSWETRTTVVHVGMDHLPFDREMLPVPYDFPYIIFVGTVEKRKNVDRIIDAFAAISPKYPDYRLVIAGGRGMLGEPIIQKMLHSPAKDKIIYRGFVSEQELIALYQHAQFTLYPSLYEGFGIPILEAMGFSCPVITSSIGSMKEVSGEAALHVNPHDVSNIADGICKLIENNALREQLTQAGHERVKQFTWQKCAQETINVYKQVL
jgi:glycosyltransferase involved in cell wall biosynthesis